MGVMPGIDGSITFLDQIVLRTEERIIINEENFSLLFVVTDMSTITPEAPTLNTQITIYFYVMRSFFNISIIEEKIISQPRVDSSDLK